ncbi:MAG: glycosyltransferase family 2 protein, partial [Butyrivibrio sp.]|nr:glycosyltransferase family 2 protein [Butyrivibrio sp.]
MNPLRQVKRALENRLIARFENAEKAASRAGNTETLPAGAGTVLLDPDALLRASEARREPLSVTIIIPSKDHPEYLSRCIDALFATIEPERDRLTCEIVVVDNGSNSKNQIIINEILNTERQRPDGITCRYLYREEPFHFGKMCNRGAAESESDLLLFLNDDTQALDSGWLAKMAACVLLPQTGAVGAKLLYPRAEGEDAARIQHCGIVNTRCGPVHKLNRLPDRKGYFLEYNRGVHRVSAVTGACLMIRRAIFDEAGGFDEAFPVSFNDVDLCFTLFEKGYTNLCCNEARLLHFESVSRGDDGEDVKKMVRLQREYRTLIARHPGMTGRDPFYPEGLTEGCDIAPEIRAEKEPLPFVMPYAVRQGAAG